MKGLEKAMNSGIFRQWEDEHPEEKLKLIFVVDSAAYSLYERNKHSGILDLRKMLIIKEKMKRKKRR